MNVCWPTINFHQGAAFFAQAVAADAFFGGTSLTRLAAGAAMALVFCLGGCASITSGTSQRIAVTAVCEGDIVPATSCKLSNDKGSWQLTTPESIAIRKSYGELTVACSKAQSSGSARFVSKNNNGAWGNLLAGGLIGYAVDSGNGAGFNYPEDVAVVLGSPCPPQAVSTTPVSTTMKE
ncbi:hypothetical protein [Polaromonas sp. YR568]|uniref:hypothetical protein n=1 Tax=Polaromonas sp. YR568 TaxID=1855301 RepID=UPI00398BC894